MTLSRTDERAIAPARATLGGLSALAPPTDEIPGAFLQFSTGYVVHDSRPSERKGLRNVIDDTASVKHAGIGLALQEASAAGLRSDERQRRAKFIPSARPPNHSTCTEPHLNIERAE